MFLSGRSLICFFSFLLFFCVGLAGAESAPASKPAAAPVQQEAGKEKEASSPSKVARDEKAILDARRQLIADKEAILVNKEQELKKLSAKIDGQIKALEEARKRLDDAQKAQAAAQKKQMDEKTAKMVKLFKAMRGAQAGKLIDGLDDDSAIGLLDKMDTKSVAKLVPFINQPRVLKWISDNLKNR